MIEEELVDMLTQNSCKEDVVATRWVHDDQSVQPLCSLPPPKPANYFLYFTATNENIWTYETGINREM
jgi:hypothetical protein